MSFFESSETHCLDHVMSDIPELQARAYEILEDDARAAIAFVDSLESTGSPDEIAALRGSIYVDAGTDLRDPVVINDGILILMTLTEQHPQRLDLSYNLANGFASLAQNMQSDEKPWYQLTSEPRRWARARFADVARASPDAGLQARALTNKANLLAQSHRWVEAFEAYRSAVRVDPDNVVAATGAAKILLRAAKRGLGDRATLHGLAREYLLLAEPFRGSTRRALFAGLPRPDELQPYDPPEMDLTGYAEWVSDERLPLALAVDGISRDGSRWDSLTIGQLIEPRSTESGVPPTFAALNVLKADFLAARWLCYTALHAPPAETGQYTDTLDYARYGVQPSLLVLSQKAAFDVLDKLAVATSEYLRLDQRPKSIYFSSFWHVKQKKGESERAWKRFVRKEIEGGGVPLVALSEIADDLVHGGFLHARRELRHAGTHRLVVLHDLSSMPSRPSRNLKHSDETVFERDCLATLRLARAAILYLIEFIAYREAQKERESEGRLGILVAPSHEWIRGEDI